MFYIKQKNIDYSMSLTFGAGDRNRTCTKSPPLEPKSSASTSSATPALVKQPSYSTKKQRKAQMTWELHSRFKDNRRSAPKSESAKKPAAPDFLPGAAGFFAN